MVFLPPDSFRRSGNTSNIPIREPDSVLCHAIRELSNPIKTDKHICPEKCSGIPIVLVKSSVFPSYCALGLAVSFIVMLLYLSSVMVYGHFVLI